jgi:predicted permease
MRKNTGFTLAAILTLALGIGANTAIFGLVDAVLLRMLPVERPEQLVFLNTADSEGRSGSPTYPFFQRLRNEGKSFAGLAAFASDELRIQVDGGMEQVFGQVASTNYFDVLGIKPVRGRLLTAADEKLDSAVAVIGYTYWQRRFGGDSNAIGKTVTWEGRVSTIVGVTPPEFWGLVPGRPIDVTLPIRITNELLADKNASWFTAFGRLKPGVAPAQAHAETNAIYQAFLADMRDLSEDARAKRFDRIELPPASQGLNSLRQRFSKPLLVLMAVVGAVLLIACANISNLLVARGAARSREFAIRLATGAGRGRLLQQLLTETILLFLFGAAAGLPMAFAAGDGIMRFFSGGRQPLTLDVQYDWRLLGFTFAIALGTGAVFGLFPAIRALRTDPQAALKDGETRTTASRRSGLAGRLLLVWQVALCVVVLATAAAFLQTMANLRSVDLGFKPDGILTMSIDPAGTELLARVGSLPGIRSASLSRLTPLSGRNSRATVSVQGYEAQSEEDRAIRVNEVSEGYFETFGIELIAGRTFTSQDAAGAPKVAVINQTAAKAYFRGDALGRLLRFSTQSSPDAVYRVVGVARDSRHNSLRQTAPRFALLPIRQPLEQFGRATLSVASALPESQLISTITREVRVLNPNALVSDVVSMNQQIDSTLIGERLISTLSTAFGLLALLLSAVGLYGVISYGVNRRTSEIGIRMALGARPATVVWRIMCQTIALVAGGIVLGLIAARFATRAAGSLLYGLSPADPLSYAVAAAVLTAVAAVTSYLPARRAAAIDPMQALRHH